MELRSIDALIVGAGFAGIYQLKKLLDQGLTVEAIDMADDVGGTWYWNRYPGAMSDTQSFLYRYSWDLEDLKSYSWENHYLHGPEILTYLQHVVQKYDLRKHFSFKTEMQSAKWIEEEGVWRITLSTNRLVKAKYLITGLGLLSKTNLPNFPNIESFRGEMYHTAKWPENIDFRGKRVGVIGNGSTGVQLITALGKAGEFKEMVSFQRNPQYSVPAGNGPVSEEYRKNLNDNYEEVWEQAKSSLFAYGFQETSRSVFSVTDEEREQIFEEAWQRGNGFRFMFWTFGDITVNEEANKLASDFIKKKIRQIVKNPEKARKLCPTEFYARRPLCDTGYYEQFNRSNVDIVDIKTNPIVGLTPEGIKTAEGKVYELDIILFATGFDAVDGNYTRVNIQGRDGETLKDHWAATGPTSYLGIAVPNFPNLFMITGPNGPFSNLPPAIECHVELISDIIARVEASKSTNKIAGIVEAEPEAEKQWTSHCDQLSSKSLFRRIESSWIFGANIPGKKSTTMFYFAGLGPYRKQVKEIIDNNMSGFKIL